MFLRDHDLGQKSTFRVGLQANNQAGSKQRSGRHAVLLSQWKEVERMCLCTQSGHNLTNRAFFIPDIDSGSSHQLGILKPPGKAFLSACG